MTEEDIKSYMQQFNVNRATAIKEISEVMDCYYKKQESDIREVYSDIIRDSY